MPCQTAERLRRGLIDLQEQFTQIGYEVGHSDASKTKAALIAKDEQSKIVTLRKQLLEHVGWCLTCRAERL